jgi:tetratricopeptide (TPR) repeat protein
MYRRACVIGVLILGIASATAAAQRLADERSRREALVHYRAGQELLVAERFELAAEQFQKAIDNDPLLALAHYGLGQAYMGLRRYASAIVAYRGCRNAYERLAALALSDRVAVERQRDDEIRELQESIRLFQSGKVKSATTVTAQVTKLEARLRELEHMRQRDIDPARPPGEVSLALGSAHFRNGQLEDAEREWKVAISTNSSLGEAHNNLAVVYMMSGRFDEAEGSIAAAERAGFRVNPQFKQDLKSRRVPRQ